MTKKPKQLDIIDSLTGEAASVDDLASELVGRLGSLDLVPEPWHLDMRPLADFLTVQRPEPVLDWGPSLTRQEFADECDINVIMATYERSGALPPINSAVAQYVDLTAIPADYQTALDLLKEAETAFMSLPATVRREFENDPRQFVEFASDPENLPQMRTWGLAPPLPPVEPAVLPASSPSPSSGVPGDLGKAGVV